MVGKIIISALMALDVIKPALFLIITKFWKIGRTKPTKNVLILTQAMCIVAILLIWMM